jgi:hypothetical protein
VTKGKPHKPLAEGQVPAFYRKDFDEDKEETRADVSWGICLFDVELAGRTRTLLVHYARADNMLVVLAAAARQERFAELRPTLEHALQTALWH